MAEADFGYGDGTVESITVPVTGGGFAVGVHWDQPEKEGPGWSEEGGGRGAGHLLVIEAAPQAETTVRPEREFSEFDLKMARFKDRFKRSPTQSEKALSETGDWDEIDEEEDGAAAKEQKDSLMDEPSLAALQILSVTQAVLLRTQLLHLLNFFRSVQRHLALSAAGLLSEQPLSATAPHPSSTIESTFHSRLDPPLADQVDATPPLVVPAGASIDVSVLASSPVMPHIGGSAEELTKGFNASDRSQWIGGREIHSTLKVSLSQGGATGEARSEAALLCVRDGRGCRVLHQQALADLSALLAEVAATTLHLERTRTSNTSNEHKQRRKRSTVATPRPAAGGGQGPVKSSRFDSVTGLPVAMRALARCLTCEVAFQSAKAKLVQSLLHAYFETEGQTGVDRRSAEDCAALGQLITDVMALRPVLDLTAQTSDEAYSSSVLTLRLRGTILHRVLGAHVAAVESVVAAERATAGRGQVENEETGRRRVSIVSRRRSASLTLQLNARLTALVDELVGAAEKVSGESLSADQISKAECLIFSQELTCAVPATHCLLVATHSASSSHRS